MTVSFKGEAEKNAIVRAPHIQAGENDQGRMLLRADRGEALVTAKSAAEKCEQLVSGETKIVLGSGTPMMDITVDSKSPSYILMGGGHDGHHHEKFGCLTNPVLHARCADQLLASDDLLCAKGAAQMAKISLTDSSVSKMEDVKEWIKDVGSTSAPWVTRVRLEVPGQGLGSWQALSSEAYLAMPIEAFSLLSAGSLSPMVLDTTIQVLSIPPAWKNSSHHDDLVDHRMWSVFYLLEPYLAALPGKSIAWVGDDGIKIIFSKRGPAWRPHRFDFMKKQTFMFAWALALNLVASIGVATGCIFMVRQLIKTMRYAHDAEVNISASHRIARRSQAIAGWRVMATQVDWPDHAVLLRWRKQTGVHFATFFDIYAETLELDNNHEVFIGNLRSERVPTMKEQSAIFEFLFHINGSPGSLSEPKHEELRYQSSYRFQVVGYDDKNEDRINESEWSNEVYITPRSSVFTFPFLFLKSFCPIPTSSLAFFLDTYAQRRIEGKTPQQLVKLTNLSITYHKNFRDFRDCDSDFYLTAYTGESASQSEEETSTGRVITFAKTQEFRPPRQCTAPESALNLEDIDEDEDFWRKDEKSFEGQEVLLGCNDRNDTKLFFQLRFASNHEDAAEGLIDWSDTMEQFEDTDKVEGDEIKTISIDFKPDKAEAREMQYNEDYLVFLLASVDFVNTIDPLCKSLGKDEIFFLKDAPGQIFYQGMERLVTWDQEFAPMKDIDLFNLHIVYPDHPSVDSQLVSENVSKASGVAAFPVEFPREISRCHVVCQLEVFEVQTNSPLTPPVLSHRFVVCQTWTLSDMELMYASFCKMNNMHMQNLTAEVLEGHDIAVSTVSLKVVPGLRMPLRFEKEHRKPQYKVAASGMQLIGSESLKCVEDLGAGELPVLQEGEDHTSHGGSAPSEQPMGGAGTGGKKSVTSGGTGTKDQKMIGEEKVFLPTFMKVEILENVWPMKFSFFSTTYGTNWVPSVLLMYLSIQWTTSSTVLQW
jgi:hypothetical protein